ncbi:aldehyde dehydrogenase family protein [Devosia elaeis]|uniref:Aldehyde dehydrogenase n=1 Tax=Devosia elaeis TaxID=1770058 RepID=A0A178HL87_9HYPH|nr:aldehyde dehydrogenase family protein [Devosia elaeis]OAM73527.1 aldehyde dehydrogenase [Devosia elaeis]
MDALNHIGGRDLADESGRWLESLDPATGKAIGRFAPGSSELAEAAAIAASKAFFGTEWAANPRLRESVLRGFADRMAQDSDQLTELLSLETGKLRHEAAAEIAAAISEARFYAGLARLPQGRSAEIVPGTLSILSREAAGVVAVIVPWNSPVTLLVRSLAPALAAGCTVVVKPASQTAVINRRVLDLLLEESLLPAGVVNIVNELGSVVGQTLVASRNVHAISFTGSTRTGAAIMAAAAPTMKRLSLELGGKSPAIVFPDVNLEKAAEELTFGALAAAGQFCMAASRFLIHEQVACEMQSLLSQRFRSLRVGPASSADSQMGPVIDADNHRRLLGLMAAAPEQGEVLVAGTTKGGGGHFLTPTLVKIDDTRSSLVQNEIFGPIITFETFSDESQALAKAHATDFGLAASVHTLAIDRAHRVARKLRAGTVWINCHRRQFAEAEVGGFGQSGLGRLHGAEALADFMETKHIHLQHSN